MQIKLNSSGLFSLDFSISNTSKNRDKGGGGMDRGRLYTDRSVLWGPLFLLLGHFETGSDFCHVCF